METIQVVLEMKRIFRKPQIGRAQMKRNRSALVRDALREHLRRLEVRALEDVTAKGIESASRLVNSMRGSRRPRG